MNKEYYNRLCKCGCRNKVKNKFVRGHNPANKGSFKKGQLSLFKRLTGKELLNKYPNRKNSGFKKGNLNPMKKVENRKRQSIRMKGRMKGDLNPAKRPEARLKIRLSKLGKKRSDITGKNHPNFNNWSSREPYSKEWTDELKYRIRKRDNFTCQECNQIEEQLGYKLSIHHIDYNKKNCIESNLISLCKSCHAQTNFGREEWEEYLKGKLKW